MFYDFGHDNARLERDNMKELEIWADSFHEGVWCCDNICLYLKKFGYSYHTDFLEGFIPYYVISYNGKEVLSFVVYGSYKSWNPLPKKIKELIDWGKPDFVAFDSKSDEILFAVEETAATPTGNQAMQRCERQYGSAHLRIPYWYFVSEFGEHVDGGIRRDNIWPSIAAIKLTLIKRTPCVVLHYSDYNNVEDYSSGKGMDLLFSCLSTIINNIVNAKDKFYNLDELLSKQYKEMLSFISSQWNNVIDFLPSEKLVTSPSTSDSIARFALDKPLKGDDTIKDSLLVWPTTHSVPAHVLKSQVGKELIKYDALSEKLENDVTNNKCYILSNNAGSGKPTSVDKIKGWISEQKALFNKSKKLDPPASFTMDISDFPLTESGNVHVTTSKNIVYLYDHWKDLKSAIESVYPRLKGKLNKINDDSPVFVYVSNSLKPGRLFGDPYTGQLSAYSTCFGKFDSTKRAVVVYFPHQVHTQAFDSKGNVVKNKGTTLYSELTDYIIFNSGVAVSLKDDEVL